MSTQIGTNHFVSRFFAINYYKSYGFTEKDVENKIKEAAIVIGPPNLKKGEILAIIKGEGRYAIQIV